MVKNLLIAFTLLAVLIAPLEVSAQTVTSSPSTTSQRPLRTQVAEADDSMTTQVMPAIEVTQQRGQAIKDEVMAKKQEFLTQIQAIKDSKKQTIVEGINEKISAANTRVTQKMSDALDKLTTILSKLEAKAEAMTAAGESTQGLLTLIVAAEAAIEEAKTAVTEQGQKEYTVEITSELTLRKTIGTMVSEFRADISAVHKSVIAAKQAVVAVIAEAARIQGNSTNEATESGNIN